MYLMIELIRNKEITKLQGQQAILESKNLLFSNLKNHNMIQLSEIIQSNTGPIKEKRSSGTST